MRIAVASSDFTKVAGHAGRARKWLIFTVAEDGAVAAPERLELAADNVFHYAEDGRPHPLDGVDAVIAQSAGEGFLRNMEKRGIRPVLTAEDDPRKAVADLLAETLTPPKARPIGALICKTIDLFSKHK
ncbi:MAG TPA: NifB/NifX family molybdenum-iron cluster-binding protein [Magnetospirillum sp.]|nr:NifB/NifX family molybdenum-iron cluster-binding protein [Magnetospirillum sp.]